MDVVLEAVRVDPLTVEDAGLTGAEEPATEHLPNLGSQPVPQ